MSTAVTKNNDAIKREKFISNLKNLREKLNDGDITFRELKATYFSINLDYIRLCEVTQNGSYFPSRNCDVKMKACTEETQFNQTLKIVRNRIDEIITSLV